MAKQEPVHTYDVVITKQDVVRCRAVAAVIICGSLTLYGRDGVVKRAWAAGTWLELVHVGQDEADDQATVEALSKDLPGKPAQEQASAAELFEALRPFGKAYLDALESGAMSKLEWVQLALSEVGLKIDDFAEAARLTAAPLEAKETKDIRTGCPDPQ